MNGVPKLVMALSGLLILVSVLCYAFVPHASLEDAIAAHNKANAAAIAAVTQNNESLQTLQAQIDPYLWNMPIPSIGPAALAKINVVAQAKLLKLTSFRPQRTADADGLVQVPFVLSIDGSFPNVLAFVKEIENGNTKLAVNQVQMSASEGSSDKVTCSIELIAYAKNPGGSNG